jgi:predicted RND superfamily exporter protein
MWQLLARIVLNNRIVLLSLLLLSTAFFGYRASRVKLSYEFSKAIPIDNPKYVAYQEFRKKFGDDGNLMVIGMQTDRFFELPHFTRYKNLEANIRKVSGVEDVVGVGGAVNLLVDTTGKMTAGRIFGKIDDQQALDSAKEVFLGLPFYRHLLHNPASGVFLLGVRINKDILASAERTRVIREISALTDSFSKISGTEIHMSGLPLIRTVMADRIQQEMKLFLAGSLLLSILTLLLFFRSFSTMLLSISVVVIGVIWTLGIIDLCGYKITLLTALMPSLIVVIGIPNCIYFLNKYHSNLRITGDKRQSILDMVGKMGVVTLFCNISAAIGFAVFALTRSEILKEFGVVAGWSIMAIFVISLILLPAILSYLPVPGKAQLKYLDNKWITRFLSRAEVWSLHHQRSVWLVTIGAIVFSIIGLSRLKTVGFVVDDIPSSDKIYTDLKFFENHFKGVMPLEILVDTRRPNGLRRPGVFERVDSLSQFIATLPETNRPLCLSEAFRFFYQGISGGDSTAYVFPNEKIVEEILRKMKSAGDSSADGLNRTLKSFMDSSRQVTRISVGMQDVGTARLPLILDTIQGRAEQLFDSSRYNITLTGTSISFLEGSKFIIQGLKESIFWAFLLIACCMIYLFRSWRVLLCSLIPNIIPLLFTAGIMGWVGVPLKPSTVLVFSVALGIAVDITIRFLVNYRQELQKGGSVEEKVIASIHQTGLSIIYTSLVLIAGFIVFCVSHFGGTVSLGWLTSVTLLTATMANILLLPVLLLQLSRGLKISNKN